MMLCCISIVHAPLKREIKGFQVNICLLLCNYICMYFYRRIIYYMKNLIYHFSICYAYSVKNLIGELNLKIALDEDTGVFSFFFSFLSSSSPLGQTAVSVNSTLHQ